MKKEKKIDEKFNWVTDPPRVSPVVLMRKFKITAEMATSICEYIGKKPIDDNNWTNVIDGLPCHEEEVIVHGKLQRQVLDNFEHYIAILDFRSGWKNKFTGENLYIVKWMRIPEEKILEIHKENPLPDYYPPPLR